jgi:hypothetical protein
VVKYHLYEDTGDVLNTNEGSVGSTDAKIILYNKENNNHNAIADIKVVNFGRSDHRVAPSTLAQFGVWGADYELIDSDLHDGTCGIALYARKVNGNDTKAIDFIGGYISTSDIGENAISSDKGYEWVQNELFQRVNLNNVYIPFVGKQLPVFFNQYFYLTVHKTDFKW